MGTPVKRMGNWKAKILKPETDTHRAGARSCARPIGLEPSYLKDGSKTQDHLSNFSPSTSKFLIARVACYMVKLCFK